MPVAERKPVEATQPLPGESPGSAGIGHNKPPVEETVAIEFREELLRERPQFMQKFDDMIAAADRVVITDDASLGLAGDLAKIHRAATQHINDTHKTVKEPYLKGGRAADAEKSALLARLEPAQRSVAAKMNAFVADREAKRRAEEERLAAEQRARSAEAEAKGEGEVAPLAPAEPKRPEPVRSDAGSTVSTKQVWNSEVEDYGKAFKAVKSNPKVKEAIDAAVAGLVRAGQREIAGVRVWATQQAVAR